MSDEENFEDIIDELSRLKNHVFSHCEDLNYLFNNSPIPETPDDIHFSISSTQSLEMQTRT